MYKAYDPRAKIVYNYLKIFMKKTTDPSVEKLLEIAIRAEKLMEEKLSKIDGTNGKLWYRGYPIEALADSSNYEEVAFLLLHGHLPTKSEYEIFVQGSEEPVVLPVFEKMGTPPYDPCRCEHRCK